MTAVQKAEASRMQLAQHAVEDATRRLMLLVRDERKAAQPDDKWARAVEQLRDATENLRDITAERDELFAMPRTLRLPPRGPHFEIDRLAPGHVTNLTNVRGAEREAVKDGRSRVPTIRTLAGAMAAQLFGAVSVGDLDALEQELFPDLDPFMRGAEDRIFITEERLNGLHATRRAART